MRSVWLGYHDVFEREAAADLPRTATVYHLSRAELAAHLAAIRSSRRRVITAGERSDGDTVAITFDDGWRGSFEIAVPLLVEAGLRATFYVTRDFIGRPHMVEPSLIVEAASAGMEIGVHGTTHRMLSSLSPAEIREEFATCRKHLEDLIGKPVLHASLPGGDLDDAIVAAARAAGIVTLCTSRPGVNTARTSPVRLRRLGIKAGTPAETIARYCRYDLLREEARWMVMQAPRVVLGMQRYSRVRRWIMDRDGKQHLFRP
jgi:peptidoglycan/xylan/chitin deacetylase (PgdA/CDA1 family)